MKITLVLLAFALVVPALLAKRPHRSIRLSEFIYEQAPYPECHASTIVETGPGRLVAAWFGGTKEKAPDVGIWVAHRQSGRWSEPVEVADGRQPDGTRFPSWNPVLFQAPGGPLVLFFKVGPSPSSWWGMMMTSTDGGISWSVPQRLPEGVLGPIKNKPIVLADGTWLSGSSTENEDLGWRVHFERSSDQGATWECTPPVDRGPGLEAIQPSLLQHRDGTLQALCRTKQGNVAMTWSSDGGKTWSPLAATELPNPNSGFDAVTLVDGRHLVVYNHTAHRRDNAWGNRWPLDAAVSTDGLVWTRVVTLESDPLTHGYAYPAVIQTGDGRVHVTYTWGRKRIRHVALDPLRF